MMNKKQLFTLALGITAVMNMNASIDRDTTTEESAIVALAAVITTESALQKNTEEATPLTALQAAIPVEVTELQATATTLDIVINPIEISLQDAQALNIDGLELVEGTTFVYNGVSYVVKSPIVTPVNSVLEESQK